MTHHCIDFGMVLGSRQMQRSGSAFKVPRGQFLDYFLSDAECAWSVEGHMRITNSHRLLDPSDL